jgi:hypothetical protein
MYRRHALDSSKALDGREQCTLIAALSRLLEHAQSIGK